MTLTSTSTVKRPSETLSVTFDFTEFVAAVAPSEVTYMLRGELGPTFLLASNTAGLIELLIFGGESGRTYLFGYEARTADGQSVVDTRRLRVRDLEGVDLPNIGSSGATSDGILVLDYEALVLDDSYLVFA